MYPNKVVDIWLKRERTKYFRVVQRPVKKVLRLLSDDFPNDYDDFHLFLCRHKSQDQGQHRRPRQGWEQGGLQVLNLGDAGEAGFRLLVSRHPFSGFGVAEF